MRRTTKMNWSQNKLVVTGNKDAIHGWKKRCLDQTVGTSTKAFTWENLLPEPFIGCDSEAPLLPVECSYRSCRNQILVNFLTAWDTPADAFVEMSTLFPTLIFTFESKEVADGFHYIVCLQDGETLFDEGDFAEGDFEEGLFDED
jgi:hypothetical protein